MTLDGKIASRIGDSSISSKTDLARVHRLRAKVDAILVGINTVLKDDPMLTNRFGGSNPLRVIVDSRARIKLKSRIMRSCNTVPTVIGVSRTASKSKLVALRSRGANPIVCGEKNVDLRKLLRSLRKMGVKVLLVEGGGEINWSMLSHRLVDEIMVTVSPKIVGGRDTVTLVEGYGFATMSKGIKLRLQRITRMKNEVVLSYEL
jgi:2,5-diamino-6-(ribosylamino)-4(3H)-pyrimidinone 5'-phosphate reductase